MVSADTVIKKSKKTISATSSKIHISGVDNLRPFQQSSLETTMNKALSKLDNVGNVTEFKCYVKTFEEGRGRVKYETGEMNISKEKGLHVLMPYKVEGQLVTWLELDQRIKFADPRIVSEQENLAIGRRTHKDAPRGYEFLKLQGKPYLMVKVEHEKETKFSKSDSLYLPFYAIPLEGLKTRTHQRSGRLILMHDKGLLIPTFITESEINSLIKEKSPKKDISGPQATGVGN